LIEEDLVQRSDSEVDVSVVVPCRNAARHLSQQLQALERQEYDKPWEVVVADNGSTDSSRRICEAFSRRLTLRIVDVPSPIGASSARNAGARAARGKKLLFVDGDDEVTPGYVAAMAEALDSAAFVTSRVDTAALNPVWNRSAHGPWQEKGLLYLASDFLPAAGPNIGISKSIFDSVGGYPEDIDFSAAEDLAFAWRVQLSGTRLQFVPGALYRYRHRDSPWGLYRQSLRWGTFLPLLYREFRSAGMSRRPLRAVLQGWAELSRQLLRARNKRDVAKLMVDVGYSLGRLRGSLRYRVLFL
jgi:glycosyltransferase involved in cell wall biosynthesis